MLTADRNLVSIGRAARQCGTDVGTLTEAATALGIRAAETIDDVPFVTRQDVERIGSRIREAREAR